MSQREDCAKASISFYCDYLGISRQGYYKHTDRKSEIDILATSIVLYCQYIRKELLPRAGMRELYMLCCEHFKDKMTIGRDQCYRIFRANNLVLRSKKKPRTTDSRHNFYVYADLLNTTPKLIASYPGELLVSDITYVATDSGWAYLSLITDAYTRLIVGYALHPTLHTDGPLKSLHKAEEFFAKYNISMNNSIHHSDRGVQYCSKEYIKELKKNHMQISMTQTGDPLHNALAERINNTIKNGWLFDCEGKSYQEVEESIKHAVEMYNTVRPHQAIGMKRPIEILENNLLEKGC